MRGQIKNELRGMRGPIKNVVIVVVVVSVVWFHAAVSVASPPSPSHECYYHTQLGPIGKFLRSMLVSRY
jgi:hypothetical protein